MVMEGDPFAILSDVDGGASEDATVQTPVSTSHPEPATDKVAGTPVSPGSLGASGLPASVQAANEGPRVEVSAATVTRMMGIASTGDLRLLEGRVDLLTSKVTGLLTKVDRVLSMFGSIPTSSDIGRLEIQIGALKSMLRELLEMKDAAGGQKRQPDTKDAAEEQARKMREGIRSSSE